MIEAGKRYRLKASRREFDVLEILDCGRKARIKLVGNRDDIELSVSDIESAIHQDQQAAPASAADDTFDWTGVPYPFI